jgi:hypothetical protein
MSGGELEVLEIVDKEKTPARKMNKPCTSNIEVRHFIHPDI